MGSLEQFLPILNYLTKVPVFAFLFVHFIPIFIHQGTLGLSKKKEKHANEFTTWSQ